MKKSELRQMIEEELLKENAPKNLDVYVIYCPQIKGYVGGDNPDYPETNPKKFYNLKQAKRIINTYLNWQKKGDYYKFDDKENAQNLTWELYRLVPVKS